MNMNLYLKVLFNIRKKQKMKLFDIYDHKEKIKLFH